MPDAKPASMPRVELRPVTMRDIPLMFEIQSDEESNRMAAVKPRDLATFEQHWQTALANPLIVPRIILADGEVVGMLSVFRRDEKDYTGYWVARAHWGRGIASRALELLMQEVTRRPIYAKAARSNSASIRVLEKCGFVLKGYDWSPETDRFLACEEARFELH